MPTNITASKDGKEVTVTVDIGSDLQDAISRFGEDVVWSNFRQSAVISAQGNARRRLKAGQTQEQIQEALDKWHPGAAPERSGAVTTEKLVKRFESMTAEEKIALLKTLQDKVNQG